MQQIISRLIGRRQTKNKIAVPIIDEDVSVTYYAICLKGRSHILERFMNSKLQNQT